MKKIIIKLLSLIAAMVVTSPLAAQTNILVNPDFEKGNSDYWGNWCMNSAVVDTQKHSGVYSVELELPAEFDKGGLVQEITNGFSIGKSLNAAAWLKTEELNDTDAFLKLEFWDKAGVLINSVEGKKFKGTKEWAEVTISAPSVPAETAMVKLILHLSSNNTGKHNGKAYFDDISLTVP